MYKLIVSDVDGTLIAEGTSCLNPQLLDYISDLRKRGIYFAAASGRAHESVKYAFKPVYKDIYVLSDNGAFIYQNDQILSCRTFQPDQFLQLVGCLKDIPDVYVMVSSLEGGFTNSKDEAFINWIETGYGVSLTYDRDLYLPDIHASKLGLYCVTGDIYEYYEKWKEQFGSIVNVFIAGERWIDLIPKNVNKGKGVEWLQDHLGVNPSETIVFGDQNNDITMFSHAARSFAVCNARDDVKAAASDVMDEGAENDGVLHVLKNIFG